MSIFKWSLREQTYSFCNNVCVCLHPCVHAGPLMVIVEYCCHGNLSTFLKTKRGGFVCNTVGPQNRLCCFACDACVCKGPHQFFHVAQEWQKKHNLLEAAHEYKSCTWATHFCNLLKDWGSYLFFDRANTSLNSKLNQVTLTAQRSDVCSCEPIRGTYLFIFQVWPVIPVFYPQCATWNSSHLRQMKRRTEGRAPACCQRLTGDSRSITQVQQRPGIYNLLEMNHLTSSRVFPSFSRSSDCINCSFMSGGSHLLQLPGGPWDGVSGLSQGPPEVFGSKVCTFINVIFIKKKKALSLRRW